MDYLASIPHEILELIFYLLNTKSQLRLLAAARYITCQILTIDERLHRILTDDIISNYPQLMKLNMGAEVNKLSHLTNLRSLNLERYELYAGNSLVSNYEMLTLTNLSKLTLGYNITQISHLTKLRKLGSIKDVPNNDLLLLTNLTSLDLVGAQNITTLHTLTKLRTLVIFNQFSADILLPLTGLTSLNMFDITSSISHLTNLTHLNINENNAHHDLKTLTNLTKLEMNSYNLLNDINHLRNLRELHIVNNQIPNSGFSALLNLTKIYIDDDRDIPTNMEGLMVVDVNWVY